MKPKKDKVEKTTQETPQFFDSELDHTLELDDSNEHFLPLLPLKNVVLLPKSVLPVIVGRASSIKAVEHALKHEKNVFITAQRDPDVEHPRQKDIFEHGTRATILQVMRTPNGSLKILVEGLARSVITKTVEQDDFLSVFIKDLPTKFPKKLIDLEASWRTLKNLYIEYAKLNEKAPQDLIANDKDSIDFEFSDYVTDTIAVHLELTLEERQNILETLDIKKRMFQVSLFLKKEIEILEIEQRIKGHVQSQVEKNQREYYLNEQIKAIHKELGREDQAQELQQLHEKIKTLKPTAEALEKVEKEIKRLEQMPPFSAESVVSRHYLDWIASLPWSKTSKDRISITQAEKILNEHHAGLKKIKERIIEFLAAKKFSKNLEKSPIICLVGAPGVGKTSLARSIAESLDREFVRISLGGVKDEAEIRGHRRTYIGALPGKIIQAMKKANTINPVILLDEIDKMSMDTHGDPSAALLEVLDPEQNKSFVDHFLDLEYDLSKVLFVATANHLEGIPYPLLDRMEIIQLSGYTNEEKLHIARTFLIPKELKEYGLEPSQFIIEDKQLEHIIALYTKEAGVRQLTRIITKLMRKAIQLFLKDKNLTKVVVTQELIQEWLGYPIYKKTQLEKTEAIGLVTGLAWTELGGDVLETEVTVITGKGNLTLTGQLGDVMQESAQAGLSYIRSRADELGLPKNFYNTKDIHVHLPEGATPKDGPSAGITMCTAIVSALTKNPVKPHLAMTGEITLRGRILGVGGLKDKLLAAQQHGITTVIVSKDNEEEIKEIMKEDHLNLLIHYVVTMDEVLQLSLKNNPFKHKHKNEESEKKEKTQKRVAIKKKKSRA